MGKLIEKIQQIGRGPSGSMGFMPRRENNDKARPAAVLVTLLAQDAGAAEAAAKAGVDAIILTSWKPGADIAAFKAACESGQTLWGVRYDGGGDDEPATAAREAGASFIVLGENASVSALFDDSGQMDRVVSISAPQSEMELLTLRAVNALPAQAALVALPTGVADLASLTAQSFSRLAIIAESLRFPLLAAVNDAPDLSALHAIVRLGIDGVVMSGVGVEASALASQVREVRSDLEKVPPLSKRDSVRLGGMLGGAPATPARPEPEHEPDEE
jgi:hypothetical protein